MLDATVGHDLLLEKGHDVVGQKDEAEDRFSGGDVLEREAIHAVVILELLDAVLTIATLVIQAVHLAGREFTGGEVDGDVVILVHGLALEEHGSPTAILSGPAYNNGPSPFAPACGFVAEFGVLCILEHRIVVVPFLHAHDLSEQCAGEPTADDIWHLLLLQGAHEGVAIEATIAPQKTDPIGRYDQQQLRQEVVYVTRIMRVAWSHPAVHYHLQLIAEGHQGVVRGTAVLLGVIAHLGALLLAIARDHRAVDVDRDLLDDHPVPPLAHQGGEHRIVALGSELAEEAAEGALTGHTILPVEHLGDHLIGAQHARVRHTP